VPGHRRSDVSGCLLGWFQKGKRAPCTGHRSCSIHRKHVELSMEMMGKTTSNYTILKYDSIFFGVTILSRHPTVVRQVV